MSRPKTIDGKFINRRNEGIHVYGTRWKVLVWKEKNGKAGFKSVKFPKLDCINYQGQIYYLSDFN